jgi:hypothetical protein
MTFFLAVVSFFGYERVHLKVSKSTDFKGSTS